VYQGEAERACISLKKRGERRDYTAAWGGGENLAFAMRGESALRRGEGEKKRRILTCSELKKAIQKEQFYSVAGREEEVKAFSLVRRMSEKKKRGRLRQLSSTRKLLPGGRIG